MKELARVTIDPTGLHVEYFPTDKRRKSSGTLEDVLVKLLDDGWELVSFVVPARGWEIWVFQRERRD